MIKYVQIFGERNSGTNYLKELVEMNFEGIEVTTEYGWKHGFAKKIRRHANEVDDVLVICIFKNPLAWFLSMHKKPHHAPQMKALSFSNFLKEEWVCYKGKGYFKRDLEKNPFKPEEEMMIERNPATGKRFENVVKLRNKKNENLLLLKYKLKNIEYLKYEDLLIDPKIVINDFALKYEIKAKQFENSNKYHGKSKKETFSKKDYYLNKEYKKEYSTEDLNFVKLELNHALEKEIGYLI